MREIQYPLLWDQVLIKRNCKHCLNMGSKFKEVRGK